jgi:hypothetical protein
MNDLDQRMIQELRPLLREMRDTDPARYRELRSCRPARPSRS